MGKNIHNPTFHPTLSPCNLWHQQAPHLHESLEHSSDTGDSQETRLIPSSPDTLVSSLLGPQFEPTVRLVALVEAAKLKWKSSSSVEMWSMSSEKILPHRRLASWRLMRKRETRMDVMLYAHRRLNRSGLQ